MPPVRRNSTITHTHNTLILPRKNKIPGKRAIVDSHLFTFARLGQEKTLLPTLYHSQSFLFYWVPFSSRLSSLFLSLSLLSSFSLVSPFFLPFFLSPPPFVALIVTSWPLLVTKIYSWKLEDATSAESRKARISALHWSGVGLFFFFWRNHAAFLVVTGTVAVCLPRLEREGGLRKKTTTQSLAFLFLFFKKS